MQIIFQFAFMIFLFVAVVTFLVWRRFPAEAAFVYWSIATLLFALGGGFCFRLDPNPRRS